MIGYTDDEAREQARKLYGSDEVEFDEDAKVSHLNSGAAWVQAWVWVPEKELTQTEIDEIATQTGTYL